jgi:rod shape determining protein RodA
VLREATAQWGREIPWRLILSAMLLCVLGLLALRHLAPPLTERGEELARNRFARQALFVLAGWTAMAVLAAAGYFRWRSAAWALYGAAVALLVLVLAVGPVVRGTRGWIPLGPLAFQPAEAAKGAVIVLLARILASDAWRLRWTGIWLSLGIVALPAALVVLQPDLGSALILGPICAAMLWAAGVPKRRLAVLAALAVVVAVPAFRYGLKDYQRARLVAFLMPDRVDPQYLYQQNHARNATAAGGFLGLGIGSGSERYPYAIPDRHTDFVFSAIGEELGFVGCTLAMLLYVAFLYEMFRIAWRSQEPFGRLLCAGTGAMVATQVVVNVGMTVGWMPVMGIPLPFLSYGGSSMVMTCAAVGLCASVGRHRITTFLTSPRARYILE